jgi:XTP/dITP diphosphohydrolase
MKNSDAMEEEFGDILFSLVNYARFVDINPENALARTNQKFINRFKLMETMIRENGDDINEMNLQEMDVYWDKAKKQLKSSNI